ncbi:hypothetical protein EVAR_100710_1 [Eumeta japonica]|uniref:Mariner Mos1 transposase n=1 Tax=Eumeta variegata TaxID=151549 RepID=A0A4C1ZM09_EUMVA|nr:hypothetical protein EVAR_100710_1 [Eumeta japonica]
MRKQRGKFQENLNTGAESQKRMNKLMPCVWGDWKGIIHYELLPPDKITNSNLYCQHLMRLKQEAEKKRPELINRKGLIEQCCGQLGFSTKIGRLDHPGPAAVADELFGPVSERSAHRKTLRQCALMNSEQKVVYHSQSHLMTGSVESQDELDPARASSPASSKSDASEMSTDPSLGPACRETKLHQFLVRTFSSPTKSALRVRGGLRDVRPGGPHPLLFWLALGVPTTRENERPLGKRAYEGLK